MWLPVPREAALEASRGADSRPAPSLLVAHAGIRAQVMCCRTEGMAKPADGWVPNRQAGLGGGGSDAAGDVACGGIPRRCRPKWKRRHSADAETGDVRGPRNYDLRRFTGKLNQPNREWRSS